MYCNNCGREAYHKSNECQYCGNILIREAPEKAEGLPNTSRRGRPELGDDYLSSSLVMPRLPDDDSEDTNEDLEISQAEDKTEKYIPNGFYVFDARGRINRLKYLYSTVIFEAAAILLYMIHINAGTNLTLFIIAAMAVSIIEIITIIKRLHDLGKSGRRVTLLAVPFANIFLAVMLLFIEGDENGARYGKYDGNAFYWQLPLVIGAIVGLFYGASVII
jgi:uncharacterized membrane protein YhaH (DUF805 family)